MLLRGIAAAVCVPVFPVYVVADNPTLQHGLQDVHGWRLGLPRRTADPPDRELLAQRYQAFSASV